MARIRTIKPGFFTSPDFKNVSVHARFLLIGLLTESDDAGKLIDSPKLIAGSLFPHDRSVGEAKVRRWLDELEAAGRIVRYTAGRGHYLYITNWLKHQRISHPTPSILPDVPERLLKKSGEVPETFGPEVEVEVEVERDVRTRRSSPSYDSDFEELWVIYPRKDAKAPAFEKYRAQRRKGTAHADLMSATGHYAKSRLGQDPIYTMQAKRFLGDKDEWKEWLKGSAVPTPAANGATQEAPALRFDSKQLIYHDDGSYWLPCCSNPDCELCKGSGERLYEAAPAFAGEPIKLPGEV